MREGGFRAKSFRNLNRRKLRSLVSVDASTHLPPAPTPKSSIKIRVEGVCDKAFHSFDFINL